MERAPRDRRSLDILSVKNEAKLSASEVHDVEVELQPDLRLCSNALYLSLSYLLWDL